MSEQHQPAPFVVGVGRSGTTLLRLMLDSHPELAIPPETHFLPALIELYADGREPDTDELVEAVETHPGWHDFGMDLNELRIAFAARAGLGPAGDAAGAVRAFYAAYASSHNKPRWGDKTPVYIESIAQIGATLGDQARFVHLIRDGRDVAVSRGARAAKRGREPTPAGEEAETWKRRIEGAREQAGSISHYREWRYEDLVADAETTLREICEYIELGFDPTMLDYHERASERLEELSDLPGNRRQGEAAARSGSPRTRSPPSRRARTGWGGGARSSPRRRSPPTKRSRAICSPSWATR